MGDNYTPQTWVDGATGGTPISAERLNNIEAGIDAVDAAVQALPDKPYVDAGDTASRNRANHVGTQAAGTITGLATVATSGSYTDLTAKPVYATVATTGSYTDLVNKPTIPAAYTDEQARDALGTALVAGANVTITVNDAADTITVAAANYTDEQAVDAVATALVAGSGVSIVYDDPNNTITFTATGGSGTNSDGDFGAVLLDSFAGADDDTKLTAALAATAADTYKRTIILQNRLYTFTTANRVAFNGMRIAGPGGYSNSDKGSAYEASEVKLSMTGPWFTNNNGNVYDVDLRNLSFKGTSSATVLGQIGSTSATSWWRLHMRDISASGVKSVLGTQAQAILLTGAHLEGFWEVNNTYNGSFHIGGSDNRLFTNGGFFDSDPAFNTAGSATGQAILWFDFCENTSIGPVYVTCESLWTGVKITGPVYGSSGANQGGPLNFWGGQFEGRNAGQGSNGAIVRMDGGIARFRDCSFHFGMISPTTPGRTPTDAGIIHHTDGQLLVSGATYDRATGVAQTVPLVYTASPGKCLVNGVQPQSRGGAWSALPVVAIKSGNAENRITDATVTLASI